MRSSERGFTLLEVMGAVVVLAMVYVVLASAAIQGLRAEGDAERRLRAGLVADARMAQLEENLALGAAPAVGSTVDREGEFEVAVDVTAFTPPAELLTDVEAGAASLLATAGPGAASVLRTVHVRVRWDDGTGVREVSRVTLALDPAAAQQALQLAGAAPSPEPEPAR